MSKNIFKIMKEFYIWSFSFSFTKISGVLIYLCHYNLKKCLVLTVILDEVIERFV